MTRLPSIAPPKLSVVYSAMPFEEGGNNEIDVVSLVFDDRKSHSTGLLDSTGDCPLNVLFAFPRVGFACPP